MHIYRWEKKDGLAILYKNYQVHVHYNKASLLYAINNVRSRRSEYFTEQAWRDDLEMFEAGMVCFPKETP
jgi:hypothetical protein